MTPPPSSSVPESTASAPPEPGAADPLGQLGIGLDSTVADRGRPWLPPRPEDLPPIPNLAVGALLGVGGMGAVYRARQTHLDRAVALKVLDPARLGDPAFAERFAREARAMARLDHPAIVRLYDYGQTGAWLWLVIELVEGATLRDVLRTGNLAPAEALRIAPQLCEALTHAHAAGVVHRDLKPENILIDGHGRPRIADFGLAKLRNDAQGLTATGTVMGTAHYMAPEQIAGGAGVDHRADLYALGVVLYEMLTGTLPLGRFAPPSQSGGIDPRLDEVVFRSLEREPARRWQSADEVRSAMAAAATAVPERRAAPEPRAVPESKAVPEPGSAATQPPPPRHGHRHGSIDVGPVHVGPDGVRIGDTVVVDHAGGVRLGRGAWRDGGQPAVDGERKLHRAGMALTVAAALLAIWMLVAAPAPHADARLVAATWAAAMVMGVGGISLLTRAGLPLAVTGGIAALVAVPWCWQAHWVLGVVAAGLGLSVTGRILDVARLRRHYGSISGRSRWWRLPFAALLIATGAVAIALPQVPGGLVLPVAAASAAEPAGDVRSIAAEHGARADLAAWNGADAPHGPRYHVRVRVRWHDVEDRAYLELWTRLADGRRFFTRGLADSGPQRAISGTSVGWQELVLPFDATSAGSAIAGADLALVIPGRGRVEIAMPPRLAEGWPEELPAPVTTEPQVEAGR